MPDGCAIVKMAKVTVVNHEVYGICADRKP